MRANHGLWRVKVVKGRGRSPKKRLRASSAAQPLIRWLIVTYAVFLCVFYHFVGEHLDICQKNGGGVNLSAFLKQSEKNLVTLLRKKK